MESDEDALMMARFVKTRDRGIFDMLFDKYERATLAHVRRFIRDPGLAEELVQDVFVRVYTTKNYRPDHRFRTWLYRVATNACLNELRRPRHRHQVQLQSAHHEPPNTVPSPDDTLEARELAEAVTRAVDQLPEKQRAAFLMVRQDGMSHEEVAVALETSISSVKSLIHRALETLRAEVAIALDSTSPRKRAFP